ncbi:hypothetical protein SAMN05216257_102585 [Meinhardsimonia xiamenensis]|jgi:hypothetical protein|uniref:Uncharacterized protein n=1 Tax=Meinhardsimonia xiamenensis TaxID=990712 RepID=A0A1G9BKL8_9RHOB|nr:hypothetical protein [Meinhardsimonia xiamenensis]PRX34941.1 hypothetical protein LV81_01534 [Meinhardsimonia xiamenensis]SDK40078.1 hypothetical protein SAMN05216257_102585 [Meinhardsimonia xiamenensis]
MGVAARRAVSKAPRAQVARRRVFYVPGFDPIHPRRYRELYRKEARRQAAISGYEIALSARQGGGRYGWHVEAAIEGAHVTADVEVLYWADIVRESMEAGIPGTYAQLARTAWTYIASGALSRLVRLRKGPVIAAFYPVAMLLAQLLLALGLGAGIGWTVAVLVHPLLGALAALAVIWAVLVWFRRHDNRLYAYYLMHDYAFAARWGGANPPALEARLAEFADAVAEALADPETDEVLVVGHSSGAHLAISLVADLIRSGRVPVGGPALSLLTLGQVVPMMSFLPKAERLRRDLNFLSRREEIAWVDVSAPGDGCTFALCDPVAVSGVAPADQRWPLVISAAFTKTLRPETWKRLRWRFFRLHFQYLCAFDRPGDYDYFRITAGPLTLAARFAGRQPSRSRITRAVSRYTSMAA